jgi:hypothetical protein
MPTPSEFRLQLQAMVVAQRVRLRQLEQALIDTKAEIAEGEQMLTQLGLGTALEAVTAHEAVMEADRIAPTTPTAARIPANPKFPYYARHPIMDQVEDLLRTRGPLSRQEIVAILKLADQRPLKFLHGWITRGEIVVLENGRLQLTGPKVVSIETERRRA